MPSITLLYAGLLGILSIIVTLGVGKARSNTGVSLGDGGNTEVITAMRRHANFVEFVPLTLLLIALLELNGVGGTAIHGLGAGLFFARVCHALGFGAESGIKHLRTVGAMGSMLVVAVASVWSIAAAL